MTEFQWGYLVGVIIASIILTIAHFYFLYEKAEELKKKINNKKRIILGNFPL